MAGSEGPSPESLSSPCPSLCIFGWGPGTVLHVGQRHRAGLRGTWGLAEAPALAESGAGIPAASFICLLGPIAKPQVGSTHALCWQGRKSGCLCLVEVGLCLLGQLAVGV